VVACDCRHSAVRQAAQTEVREFGVPIDVLWFHISRQPGDSERALGNFNCGKALIRINRENYYQAGMIIRKGSFAGRPLSRRPHLRIARLGPDQAFDRKDQPAAAVAPARPSVHRRRRSRDVSRMGRGHQSGNSGCHRYRGILANPLTGKTKSLRMCWPRRSTGASSPRK
jgi:2-polyprenyl-6-methoxyphenol hydroxylase-like FAD-dependent oxidoreductase